MKCFVFNSLFRRSILLFFVVFFANTIVVCAANKHEKDDDLSKAPPRIIRPCCAFGSDLHLWGLPFFTINQITGIENLGEHHYMGKHSEGNGIIYSQRGGFIDIGHLRDQADWTRYLYHTIINNRGKGEMMLSLGYEGGDKQLYFTIPAKFDTTDCVLLAGKIAFDLSLWHELSTWFGASAIPMMPERYSSFSIEDVYSNLLGVHIGIEAILSNMQYNQSVTDILLATLDSLGAVKTEAETYAAFDAVNNLWFTRKKRIPSEKILIKRDTDALTSSHPWLIPDSLGNTDDAKVLYVPRHTTDGQLLTSFYQLLIDLNYKFPVEEIFPDCANRIINQEDFGALLKRVAIDIHQLEQISYSEKRNLKE